MDQDTVTTTDTKQMVIFRIADELFAADISFIREVVKLESLTPVPGSTKSIAGIINIRGRIVPVMELGIIFNIGAHVLAEAYVLLIDTADSGLVGMVVDRVVEIKHFSVNEIKPAPKIIKSRVAPEFIAGVILPESESNKDNVILLVDLQATINKSLADAVNEVRSSHEKAKETKEAT